MAGFDEVGPWSEAKLEIVRDYGKEYSSILTKQERLTHAYIDAFAGARAHVAKGTGEMVPGSPLNALAISPPFADYHFIDTDIAKIGALRAAVGERGDVKIYPGDCNRVLLETVFPMVRYEDFRRALCLLDPLRPTPGSPTWPSRTVVSWWTLPSWASWAPR